MGWPQWFMAVMLGLALVGESRKFVRRRDLSSTQVTVRLFALWAWIAVWAYVLHAGRFW